MFSTKISSLFICILFVFQNSIYTIEPELLKTSDINKIMQQIFDQHVNQKKINTTVIKHAFRIYIDQFDPFRIYLLNSEVQPFLELSDNLALEDIQEYNQHKFNQFKKLNDLIQKAILRARVTREELENKPAQFFKDDPQIKAKTENEWNSDLKTTFAPNEQDLRKRIKNHIQEFITEEKIKYGADKINQNQAKTLAIYDHYFRNQENGYLFLNSNGQPLSDVQSENLFTLHVLKALANSLDAHTTFYNNAEAYDVKVRLEKEFQGVGIVMEQAPDGSVLIKGIMEGGPAAKSGLVKINDQILAIDGTQLINMSLNEVMELIRGKAGTALDLQIKRKVEQGGQTVDKLYDVKLQRAAITLNDDRAKSQYENFGNGIIGKITLNSFYHGDNGISSSTDVRNAILDLQKKGNLRGLILDLRENSGGFLTQAVQIAGLFITNGVVVISKYSDGTEHYYRDMDNQLTYKGPLIILTSKATASAAEIVAQALQDYGVALVVGDERTYGKGTIQSQTVTDNNASTFFKVTIGEYFTPSGHTPQINGVKADILLPGKLSEEHIGEKYLEYALPAETITPEYQDDLKDVDSSLKSWYLRYYYPTLQPKIEVWRGLIPVLTKNSQYRVEHNKNYQAFLKQIKGLKSEPAADKDESAEEPERTDFGVDDLQMAEAVNIVKDMIILHSQDKGMPVNKPTGFP
jgi:carboxyl-terminal processing protease